MPKISVIMPVYNGERYLKDALQSVLNQSYRDFECIVIDDGSTDSSAEIIQAFNDPRIVYVQKNHSGIVDSLNHGISISKGEYVARFDCDDICEAHRLEGQLRFFDTHPEYAMVGSHASVIDENGIEDGKLEYPPLEAVQIRKYALLHNPFIHSSVMIRREILDKVGTYKKLYRHVEDYELWTRIAFDYSTANISQPLIKYRIHSRQVTKKNNLEMKIYGALVRTLALFRYVF